MTNISQELLHIGLCNLVQVLWIICCFMWKRIRFLLFILPLISSFFFLSNFQISKKFHLFSQGLRGTQSWNLVHTWTVGWCYHEYLNQAAGVYLSLYFSFSQIALTLVFVTLFCEAYKVETWYTHRQRVDLFCTPNPKSQNILGPLFFFFFPVSPFSKD